MNNRKHKKTTFLWLAIVGFLLFLFVKIYKSRKQEKENTIV
ncbi:MAG: hypothetical protein PHS99_04085 [Candidatus Marinimicrobia bacterium]|nr:hypothetical protein [Candidatus Neomarinimicrobiota bacterium]